jgi:hypothetical protein
MGVAVFPVPSAASKTRYIVNLTSGSSWTVPVGVTYVNVTLYGAGGGGSVASAGNTGGWGRAGQVISSYVTTTPGNSISYSIGAGGTVGVAGSNTSGGAGGNTTFTGATTANGGAGGGTTGTTLGAAASGESQWNGGQGAFSATTTGGTGGGGKIDIEYWI